MYGDHDAEIFLHKIQQQICQIEHEVEQARAVVHVLSVQLINVAYDDPATALGSELILPMLQERIDARGEEWEKKKAAKALEDILEEEVCLAHWPGD